jgi:bla regulator protein BlaR1
MIAVADLSALLAGTTLASSVALLLVLLLRRPLRAAFGAAVGYGIWGLVPAALLAVLLPAATAPMVVHAVVIDAVTRVAMTAAASHTVDYAPWACMAWVFGAALVALHFVRQQRRFMRTLGRLHLREDGLVEAEAIAGLPAAIGLLRPRIFLPADHDTRYSIEQQQLMQMHERTHIARGDLQANAIAALLRCVFWFNPLLHFAVRHFRHDQELACDQRVIALHPHSRRAYGEAMFKTQLATQPLPLGCHWLAFNGSRSHPLKERIAMLKQPVPSLSRSLSGAAFVIALTFTVGVTAWAAQPSKAALRVTHRALPHTSTQAINHMPPPAYPVNALAQHVGGKVELEIGIDAEGNPADVVVVHAEPVGVFDQAAIDAAKKWKFQPKMEHGRAVANRIRVPIDFRSTKSTARL